MSREKIASSRMGRKRSPGGAKRIKGLRDALDLKQAEFAKRLHVTQATVSSWEAGDEDRAPSAEAYFRLGTLAREQADRIWFWARAGLDEQTILAVAANLSKDRVKEGKDLAEKGDVILVPRFRETMQRREEAGPPVPLPTEFIPNPGSTICFVVDRKATAIVDSPKAIFILDESEKDAPILLPFRGQVVFARYKPETGTEANPYWRPGIYMGRIGFVQPFELTAGMAFWASANLHLLTGKSAVETIPVGRFTYSAQNELAGIDPNTVDSQLNPRVESVRKKAWERAVKELKLEAGWSILGRVLGRLKLADVENA